MTTLDRRAVVLVGGPALPYSRALRIARTLTGEGYEVEIAAIAAKAAPPESYDGSIVTRRYVPSGWFARHAPAHTVPAAHVVPTARPPRSSADAPPSTGWRRVARGASRPIRRAWRRLRALPRWLLWPWTVRGWWATLANELAPADLYHACGVLTIAPALAAADRDRRAGRRPVVIYDIVDNAFEGNNVLSMPKLLRRYQASRERRWALSADALTTVNDALSRRLSERWSVALPVVVQNYPELAPADDGPPPDLIRAALGLPSDTRIVLFQGRLSPNLGLDEAAEAVLRVDRACLVLLGFGWWMARSLARDADPRFAGRHFTLPAVHPDELQAWTASADASLVSLPAVSANQRDSTPNKFWESLLVGTPVVLGPGLDLMAGIVADIDAGVVASSLEPDALAEAIATVLDVPRAARDERRRRVAAVAAERYTWPVAAERYRVLIRSVRDKAP